MSADEVVQKVQDIIAESLGVKRNEVVASASFIDDLNADSLDIVELVMTIEKEFDIEIPDDEAERIRTVQDAIDYIRAHVTGPAGMPDTDCYDMDEPVENLAIG